VVRACGTPAEIRASTDPVVLQFIHGRATGPMDTPGF
jgi:ABC-type transporter Mla maintaining outer membrane lipid asymmetry ATPase subunit MlaF